MRSLLTSRVQRTVTARHNTVLGNELFRNLEETVPAAEIQRCNRILVLSVQVKIVLEQQTDHTRMAQPSGQMKTRVQPIVCVIEKLNEFLVFEEVVNNVCKPIRACYVKTGATVLVLTIKEPAD